MEKISNMLNKSLSLWHRLWKNRLVRILLVALSLLFIAGGAFNDGLTSFYFALPFVALLYFALPVANKKKTIIVVIAFLLMVAISQLKYYSSWVYPVIGQKVLVTQDIPLEFNGDIPAYDYFFNTGLQGKKDVKAVDHVSSGSVFYIKRIFMCGDLQAFHCYVMSDGSKEIEIPDFSISDWSEPKVQRNFCNKSDWEYCLYVKNVPWYQIDPMRKPFRMTSDLMWYPFLPFLFNH